MRAARIEVLCGPMFSGKTDELLRRLRRLKFAKKKYVIFKPKLDTRFSENEVVTHEGVKLAGVSVDTAQDILNHVQKHPVDVVAIDEAQFFSRTEEKGLVNVVRELARKGIRVIISGLDMDYFGDPFGLMPDLMAVADEVTKLKAVCSVCGEEASMSKSKLKFSSIVELGGEDKYEPRCLLHWDE